MEQHAGTFQKVVELETSLTDERASRAAVQEHGANDMISGFIKEAGIPLPTDGNVLELVKGIYQTGADHPSFPDVLRLQAAAQLVDAKKISYAQAWGELGFGVVGKKTSDDTKLKQKKAVPRSQGGRPPAADSTLANIPQNVASAINSNTQRQEEYAKHGVIL